MTIKQIYVVYNAVPIIYLYMNEKKGVPGSLVEEIEFNELGKYISLMKQQQEALGEFVNFQKGVWRNNDNDFDCVLIDDSDTPIPSTGESYTAKIFINGIDPSTNPSPSFYGGQAGIADNIAILSPLIYSPNAILPLATQIRLEELSGTFENDYTVSSQTPDTDVRYVVTDQDGSFYTVWIFFWGQGGGVTNGNVYPINIDTVVSSLTQVGNLVLSQEDCGNVQDSAYLFSPVPSPLTPGLILLDGMGAVLTGYTTFVASNGDIWTVDVPTGQLLVNTGNKCNGTGGLINYNINSEPGGILEFLDASDNVLDSYSTTTQPGASGSTTNALIRKIRGRWIGGSGNIVQLRICGELSELYFNPNIIVGNDGTYTLPANLGSYNETFFVSLRSGNVTPPACPI